jgi:N,N'-diacetyllegionaminate synthase
MRTLIIAEAGVNHNGDVGLAARLIDAAADAGADAVKFQTYVTELLVVAPAPKAEYQVRHTGGQDSQAAMLRSLQLPPDSYRSLARRAQDRGIAFLSTAFDVESANLLAAIGVDRLKIPSGEITNLPYLRHIGSLGKPVLLSTGMATLGEIEVALAVLEAAGTPRSRITVLHCTTEYPAAMADVNLRAMESIARAFGVQVGYSDHTLGIEVAVAAVALGAVAIEKHFTLDRDLPGPDHRASLLPSQLREMIDAIRNIEVALGDGIKRPTPAETRNQTVARRSLVAARPIRKGEKFTPDNLTAKRPGTGLSPMRWDEVLGRCAPRDFAADELVQI